MVRRVLSPVPVGRSLGAQHTAIRRKYHVHTERAFYECNIHRREYAKI